MSPEISKLSLLFTVLYYGLPILTIVIVVAAILGVLR